MKTINNQFTLVQKLKFRLWEATHCIPHLLKRSFDILCASLVCLLLSPIFIIISLLIKRDSAGPILFKQTRVGKYGEPFTMWKFRSMSNDADQLKAQLQNANETTDGVIFKIKQDPRITNIGRFIRKTSIDELPQLFNVIKGDMSLVGPRPPLPSEVAQYSVHDRTRLDAVPGITCLWQISGRSDIPFKQQVKLDIDYIEGQSIWQDIKILLLTIPAVISGKGAY